jgi:3'-phosphoadenosine 5'-phosphosulfate sulfotransferase (PAPS reductase)/FAD synthetase
MKQNGKSITMTGMMRAEGGQRMNIPCIVTAKDDTIKKFHPMAPLNEDWEKWFIESRKIKLCELYYPPYNFERTGCKGCPFSFNLQRDLDILEKFFPSEKKQCEYIWKKVYDEYRRIGYRLRKYDENKLFDF